MTVADEKVEWQLAEIERQVPRSVCAVDQRQHALVPAYLRQPLKRHPHAGQADHRVEQRDPDAMPRLLFVREHPPEPLDHLVVRDGVSVLDLDPLRRRRLGDVFDRLLARPVDGAEVDDPVAVRKHHASEDRVDGRRRVGHEDERLDRHVEEGGHGRPRLVQETRILVADELVRAGFRPVLEVTHLLAHRGRVCAERPLIRTTGVSSICERFRRRGPRQRMYRPWLRLM